MDTNYSVLMSLYEKESPKFFSLSLDSMINQTVSPSEIVIVKDGLLPKPLEDVLSYYSKTGLLKIISLNRNMGLGTALRIGLEHCSSELIARMDTDDISVPKRCEVQLQAFNDSPELDIVGGQIQEFRVNPYLEKDSRHRQVPESFENIVRFAKTRNPFNHMTVMFKKSSVLSAGNYMELNMFEDYYLWIRMFMRGSIGINLNEVLVYARVGNGMYSRRGGLHYFIKTFQSQKTFYKSGYLTRFEYIRNCLIRMGVAIAPQYLRKGVYNKVLRRRVEDANTSITSN